MGYDMRFPILVFPADGECVYSSILRTHERTGIPVSHLRIALTGNTSVKRVLSNLPACLTEIPTRVLLTHPWADIKTLAAKYTLYPYFTYFDSDASKGHADELLEGNSSSYLKISLGLTHYKSASAKNPFRVCPQCITGDDLDIGFSFYHREHQAPGVAVCWKHGSLLEVGCCRCGSYPIKGKGGGMPGRCHCGPSKAPMYAITDRTITRETLLWIAQESAYIIAHERTTIASVREKLKSVSLRRGYQIGGQIQYSLLSTALEQKFGRDCLRFLGYPAWIDGKPSAWVRRAFTIRDSRSPVPVYLLLIGILAPTVKEFEECDPGDDQEICQAVVHAVPIKADSDQAPSEVTGNEGWKKSLRDSLIANNNSIDGTAKRLKVTANELAREAILQGIHVPFEKRCRVKPDRLSSIKEDLCSGLPQTEVMKRNEIGECSIRRVFLDSPGLFAIHEYARKKWYANDHKAKISQFVADNPGAPREEIRKKLPGSYDYIIKTDPDWFWNLIPRAKGQRRAPSTRRGAGDSAIAASFQAAADGLRSMSRPVRITSYGICKAAGVTHNVMGRLNEFPITAAVLSKYSETMEAFRDRKLCWAIAKMASSKVPISVNLLRRWAGMPAKHVYDRVDLIQKAANESGAEVQHRSLFAKQDRGELPAPSST